MTATHSVEWWPSLPARRAPLARAVRLHPAGLIREVDGNLQCKENVPPPTGGDDVVRGTIEDQRRNTSPTPGAPINPAPSGKVSVDVKAVKARLSSFQGSGRSEAVESESGGYGFAGATRAGWSASADLWLRVLGSEQRRSGAAGHPPPSTICDSSAAGNPACACRRYPGSSDR